MSQPPIILKTVSLQQNKIRKNTDGYQKNNDGSREWNDVRKDIGYDRTLPGKRKEGFKTQDVIIDAYTGRPLQKDGSAHLDHIVSAKEIESNPRTHLFQTPEERAEMAIADSNLAFTSSSINQSKGEQQMDDFLSKKDRSSGQTNAERFGIDEQRARQKDNEARKGIKRTIDKATSQEIF